jgi:hypothetical protein
MIQPTLYVCDRCGLKSDYLPKVFDKDYDSRLCDMCYGFFMKEYKLWCNDPKPVDLESVTTKGLFKSWLK